MAKRKTKRTGRRKGRTGKGMKTLLIVGAAAGAGYLLYKAMQKPAGEGGEGGQITLQIIPAGGGVGYRGIGTFPVTLVEGSTGNQAIVTVTNTSVYTREPTTKAPYNFGLRLVITNADETLLIAQVPASGMDMLSLGAGAVGTKTWSFDLPYGFVGTAKAKGLLYPTAGGVKITEAVATCAVTASGVTPGGTIIW